MEIEAPQVVIATTNFKVDDFVRVHHFNSKYWSRIGRVKKVCKKQLKVDFDNPEGQYEYEYVFKQHVSVANPPSKKCGSESEEEEDLGS